MPSPWVRATTRRTTALRAAAQRFPWRKALVPVLAFLGIMAVGVLVRQVLPKAKGAVRTVAIVGFENLTGEAAYEYLKKAIPNLLITSLEQSKYLDVVSWERLNDLAGPRDRDVTTRRGPGLLVRGLPALRRRRHRARELHQGREPVRHRRQDLRRPDQEPPQEHGLARRGGREHPQDADRRAQPRDRQGRGRVGAGRGQGLEAHRGGHHGVLGHLQALPQGPGGLRALLFRRRPGVLREGRGDGPLVRPPSLLSGRASTTAWPIPPGRTRPWSSSRS